MSNWLVDRILSGIDLHAKRVGRGWRYTLGGESVMIGMDDMLAVFRSSGISSQRLAGDVLRYYHTTIQQRKLSRKQRREAREAKK